MIDVGRSIRIARAQQGISNKQIAEHFGIHVNNTSLAAHRKWASAKTIQAYADFFGMKPSEFIALGEIDDEEAR